MIIPIPFFGWLEIEEEDGTEGTNKTAVEENTGSSSSRGINEGSTVETKSE